MDSGKETSAHPPDEESAGSLGAEVARLESLLVQETAIARRTSNLALVVAVVLAVVVLGFSIVNYTNLSAEFTEEKLSASFEKELREFSPTAFRELEKLGEHVVPRYMAEIRSQLRTMGPELASRFERELELLTQDILGGTDRILRDVETRVIEKSEEAIAREFPPLADESSRQLLAKRLRASTEETVTRSIVDFHARFGKHVDELREHLLEFDVSDGTEQPVDLQKRFIHLWLELLDQEIMEL